MHKAKWLPEATLKIAEKHIHTHTYTKDKLEKEKYTHLNAEFQTIARRDKKAFLYFFALMAKEGFLISPCYSLELYIQVGISFLCSFAFCFSSFHSYL